MTKKVVKTIRPLTFPKTVKEFSYNNDNKQHTKLLFIVLFRTGMHLKMEVITK